MVKIITDEGDAVFVNPTIISSCAEVRLDGMEGVHTRIAMVGGEKYFTREGLQSVVSRVEKKPKVEK
jgi:uncharacterized protein YlzI (FlbEa/FlbD family)